MIRKVECRSSNWHVREIRARVINQRRARPPQARIHINAYFRTRNISGISGSSGTFTKATALSRDVLCKHARSNQSRSAKHKRALHCTSYCEDSQLKK